jgi:cyanophycin synthetase
MSLARVTLSLLCGYCFLLRGVRSKVLPGVRRMRAVREDFYVNMWRSSAEAVGARFNVLPDGGAEIQRSGLVMKVCANSTSLDDGAALERAGNKLLVCSLLARFGIPVPRHIVIEVGEFERALHMLRSSAVPLVVKPAANTGGGAGVSTNVATPHRLRAAVAWARAYGSRVLVQEQVEGDCYRVLVMDGEVLDTVVRHPPSVIGDDISTVRQLMRHENELRREMGISRAQGLIRFDLDLRNTLSSQGLNLDSRPPKGEVVVLKRVINDNGTRENVPVNGCLSPAILETACKAVDVVGVRLAGVDIISRDPSVPLERSGGAVIEVNTNPGLYYHYRATGSSFPVAEQVLNRFFTAGTVHQNG